MVPMAAVMLLAVLFVEGVGALLSVHDAEAQIAAQIHEVARIASEANFPLTAPVLRQMKALSGAELIVVDSRGNTIATQRTAHRRRKVYRARSRRSRMRDLSGSDRVQIQDRSYFHTVVSTRAPSGNESSRLHILFPEAEYERAWQREVYPPLGFMAVALPIVLLLVAFHGVADRRPRGTAPSASRPDRRRRLSRIGSAAGRRRDSRARRWR